MRLFPNANIVGHERDMHGLGLYLDDAVARHGFVKIKPRDKWLLRAGGSGKRVRRGLIGH